jgi:hypothetical protein
LKFSIATAATAIMLILFLIKNLGHNIKKKNKDEQDRFRGRIVLGGDLFLWFFRKICKVLIKSL